MSERLRLAVTTPWYPGANNTFSGVFVQHAIEAVRSVDPSALSVQIIHSEDWSTPANPLAARAVRASMRALTGRGTEDSRPIRVREGELLRVRVPSVPGRGYARHAGFHVDAVRRALPGGVIDADVVHAHEGLFGGLVAARLTPPGVRVVVTEHDTRLRFLLAKPEARALYGEVMERATAFLAVSRMLAEQIRGYVPEFAHKVQVLPNAVAFDQMPMRERQVEQLNRWLYVGRLLPHKGVRRLLASFAVCAADDPRLRLTFIGGGPLLSVLRDEAVTLGVADRVTFLGPVPHERVRREMAVHDLLVHLSQRETFGMTLVEAVSTGLPVLASRSGGPQETLDGLEPFAGRLVDVHGDDERGLEIEEVVDTYREMVRDITVLDLPRARAVLLARYGEASVGRRLLDLYRQEVPR